MKDQNKKRHSQEQDPAGVHAERVNEMLPFKKTVARRFCRLFSVLQRAAVGSLSQSFWWMLGSTLVFVVKPRTHTHNHRDCEKRRFVPSVRVSEGPVEKTVGVTVSARVGVAVPRVTQTAMIS